MTVLKTKKFKTIKSYTSLYEGWAFRATSNGEVVHLQRRSPNSSSFRTAAKMSYDDFEKWAERSGAYASCGNPDYPYSMDSLILELTTVPVEVTLTIPDYASVLHLFDPRHD